MNRTEYEVTVRMLVKADASDTAVEHVINLMSLRNAERFPDYEIVEVRR